MNATITPPREDLITCEEAGSLLGLLAPAVRHHVRAGHLALAVARPRCWLVRRGDVLKLKERLAATFSKKAGRPRGKGGGEKSEKLSEN